MPCFAVSIIKKNSPAVALTSAWAILGSHTWLLPVATLLCLYNVADGHLAQENLQNPFSPSFCYSW